MCHTATGCQGQSKGAVCSLRWARAKVCGKWEGSCTEYEKENSKEHMSMTTRRDFQGVLPF